MKTKYPQHQARVATVAGSFAAFLAVAAPLGIFGAASDYLVSALWLGALTSLAIGITRLPKGARAPWIGACVGLSLTLIGAGLREMYDTLGDVSESRSLLPDLFSGPGYILLVIAMGLVVRNGRKGVGGSLDALLDAVLAGLAVLVLCWVYIIEPALMSSPMTFAVRLSVVGYPPVSVVVFVMTAQLAFLAGSHRSPAQRAAVVSMASMFVGDMLFTITDAGVLTLNHAVMMTPYLITFTGLVYCGLHPSFEDFSRPVPTVTQTATAPRLAMVGVALTVPALVAVTEHDVATADRVVLAITIMLLTCIASWRVVRALQSHARSERELLYQASHDMLTGSLNRASLERELERLASRNVEHSVLFVDMDRFKLVNDTYGHAFGDELLKAMTQRLSAVRSNDLVARIGGDEFVLVVVGDEDPLQAAAAVRQAFNSPFEIRNIEIPVSISLGIATSDLLAGPTELLRDADTAMYGAKDAGRDAIVVFDASMRDRATRRLDLEGALRHALDRGECSVHFQPVVDPNAGRVIGFEALMRWNHPQYGTVSPADFIPIAEETGVIVQLGAWILQQSCQELTKWHALSPRHSNLWVSVNVSARQLLDPDLVYTVERSLASAGLDGSSLVLEVTESMLLEDGPRVPTAIERLRASGVRLSIDDFGTGYSSLSYLQRYPFDCVKIDRAFIEPIGSGTGSDPTLVLAIIAMAKALGMSTIAEGVETEAQVEFLRGVGCGAIQGYFYSRPVAADLIPGVIEHIEESHRQAFVGENRVGAARSHNEASPRAHRTAGASVR